MTFISQLAGAYALAMMGSFAPSIDHDALATAAAAAELPTLWAGHQVTLGTREIPFKGEVQTRMDSFVLARVRRDGDLVRLEQTACDVRFAKVAGVTVVMNASKLPRTQTLFAADLDEGDFSGHSIVAWADEDIDDDGNPGMTVRVQAPVCSGSLFVSNRSKTKATATIGTQRIEGRAKVHVRQEVLGAEGACLSAVAQTTDERVSGPFAYVPVPEGTTCETLFRQGWPVIATD